MLDFLRFFDFRKPYEQKIDETRPRAPDHHADKQIAEIMHSEIEARIACDQCPKDESQRQPPVSEKHGDKHSQPPAIGCVGRGEAVVAAPVSIDHMHHIGYRVLQVAWPEPCHPWPYEARSDLIRDGDNQDGGTEPEQGDAPRVVACYEVEETQVEERPYVLAAIKRHEDIPKRIVARIDIEEYLCVHINKVFQQISQGVWYKVG